MAFPAAELARIPSIHTMPRPSVSSDPGAQVPRPCRLAGPAASGPGTSSQVVEPVQGSGLEGQTRGSFTDPGSGQDDASADLIHALTPLPSRLSGV